MTVSIHVRECIAWVTVENRPVNALSRDVRKGLFDAVTQTEADDAVRAVVLRCSGRTFIAGADIREFGQPAQPPSLPQVIREIENARKPWLAAMHGTALGGGLEVALACSHRLATKEARLGLPEVSLGLIPGAGGTVRLPRLVPADAALDIIAFGKPIDAARALEIGLIDRVAMDDLEQAAMAMAAEIAMTKRPAPLLERAAIPPADPQTYAQLKERISIRARGQSAPLAAIQAVETSLRLTGPEALTREREAFQKLRDAPQSAALRYIFLAEKSVVNIPAAQGATPRTLSRVGVVGGGTMGAGIAAACLLAGLEVRLLEQTAPTAEAAHGRITGILQDSLARGILSTRAHAASLAALTVDTDIKALADCDLIIEAVFEDMAIKQQVFARIDQVARNDAVLATNTSYLDVNEIARQTKDPSRVIGLHFFSPAHVMKLLELVVSDTAAPDVVATGLAAGRTLGKITVPAGVCDGFIGNRIMSAYRREADYLIADGALPQDVDRAMTDFGFPMGIFAMQDLAGLDIGWAMRKRRAAARPADERYVDIADRLCEAGRLGRKTKKGWYDYSCTAHGEPDSFVDALILDHSARHGIARRSFSAAEIMARILTVMQDEGRKCVAEGIAATPEAVDVVMVNGYGFPRWKGGPMYLTNHPKAH